MPSLKYVNLCKLLNKYEILLRIIYQLTIKNPFKRKSETPMILCQVGLRTIQSIDDKIQFINK